MMDMFFQTSQEPKKKRVHFHKFMLDVHKLIHEYKQGLLRDYGRQRNINLSPERDPVIHAARKINEEAKLLCFDEFQVTDIADALIMTKLFNELWMRGTILLATSNRPPSDLYLGGINREYFLPFIEEVQRRCIVRNLQSQVDYRQVMSTLAEDAYYTPLCPASTEKLTTQFRKQSGGEGKVVSVPVMMGRELSVLARGRICFVTFSEICEGNKGAADYSALAQHMDVIYMDGIPQLSVLVR
jgi:predicted ATPase